MLPPCSTSSTNISSSSCVTFLLLSVLSSFASSFLRPVKSRVSGVKTIIRRLIRGAENMLNFSGFSFARLLGLISPKIKTTIVTTTVEIVAPLFPYNSTKSTVPSDATRMLTILFPMRMVDKSLSYLSQRCSESTARRLPFSAIVRSLVRLRDEKAVSVAEKYAERMMHIIMATIIEMWFIGSKLLLVEFAGMGMRATKKRSERKTFGYAFEHMRNT